MKYKKTIADYAQKYEVNERTIRRWQTMGYPLDDAAALAKIVSRQKNFPRSYRHSQAPGTRNRHDITPQGLAFLTAAQMMRQRSRLWSRKIRLAVEKHSKDAALREAVRSGLSLLDLEIKGGIFDMVKAHGGASLSEIKAERSERLRKLEAE